MKRVPLILAAIVVCAMAASAQDSPGGIVYGPDWAYMISAPHGFKWDSTALQKQSILGLFYPADQPQYEANKLNMYINPVRKGGGYPTDVDALIKWDTDYFTSRNPGLVISYYKDLPLGDKNTAKIFDFDDTARKYYMLYGYTTESNCSFVFVLIARSPEQRTEYEKAYAELLGSFSYMNKK